MRIPDALAGDLLVKSGAVKKAELKELIKQVIADKRPLQDIIISQRLVSEKQLAKLYAKEIKTPFTELKLASINSKCLRLMPERVARQANAVVFEVEDNGTKLVAMTDPKITDLTDFLKKHLGPKLKFYLATTSDISRALDQYRNISNKVVLRPAKTKPVKSIVINDESEADNTINQIIESAISTGASDIHIEPRQNLVVVRYRVDGLLKEVNKLPKETLQPLMSRLKTLSGAKTNALQPLHSGQFEVEVSGKSYGLRVSTLPLMDGEKAVVHILNQLSKPPVLADLGLWGAALTNLSQALNERAGLLLVSGPDGSGKSMTLFSMLSMMSSSSIGITTIEDPIEYKLSGSNQVELNNLSYVSALKAVLKQDASIIMVDEIHSSEMAKLVVSSVHSRLILSSLHTKNAAGCFTRLKHMGVESYLTASSLKLIVAQRLVRRLCPDCRESFRLERSKLKTLFKAFGLELSDVKQLKSLEQAARAELLNSASLSDLSTNHEGVICLWKASDNGCKTCGYSGYKGRIGIFEVLPSLSIVQQAVIANKDEGVIEKLAKDNGVISLRLDGLVKSLIGLTSVDEVIRACAI